MELVNQASGILLKGAELMKNPAISGAVTGMFSWLKGVLGKKSAQEKLSLIEQNKHDESTIAGLKANLEFILEDNEDLQKQLAEKIEEVDTLMQKEGMESIIITSTSTVGDNSDGNVSIQGETNINSGGGDINFGGNK